MEAGDIVFYHTADSRGTVEATILAVRDDGSLDLAYPHPADESVPVRADSSQPGSAIFQWQDKPKAKTK